MKTKITLLQVAFLSIALLYSTAVYSDDVAGEAKCVCKCESKDSKILCPVKDNPTCESYDFQIPGSECPPKNTTCSGWTYEVGWTNADGELVECKWKVPKLQDTY